MRAQLLASGAISAGKLDFKGIRALRERSPLPDLSRPAWLDPPDRAAYHVPRVTDARWNAVQLDDGSRALLDEVYAAIPRLLGSSATAEVWFERDPESEEQLAVNIGEHRVGRLTGDALAAHRDVMNRAAERGEVPYADARITPRPPPAGYLLEVQLPG